MGTDGFSTNLVCSMGQLKLGVRTARMDYRAALGKSIYLEISSPSAVTGDSEKELPSKLVEMERSYICRLGSHKGSGCDQKH